MSDLRPADSKKVINILRKRGLYNGVAQGMTEPVIKASVRFIESVAPGTHPRLTSIERIRIAVLQCHLKLLGFDPGIIDGYFGPLTREAKVKWEMASRNEEYVYFRDIDPPKPIWPYEKDMIEFYGERGENMIEVDLPYQLVLDWSTDQKITRLSVNKHCADSLLRVLEAVKAEYGEEKIKVYNLHRFGGCFNNRLKRGSENQWSIHSWAAALDWWPSANQLRWGMDRAALAKPQYKAWWEIWEAEGWVSLGRQRNYDWMHVQAARLNP